MQNDEEVVSNEYILYWRSMIRKRMLFDYKLKLV